jgi:hypothetical protein
MGSALSDLRACSNALAPGPGILMLDIRHRLVLWGRHGSTKPHWGHALFTVRGAQACWAGQSGPKPFGGLLRGKHGGCTLDLLVLARTTLARHSCKVWWCVVLSEGARVVVGEGAWLSASGLARAPRHRPPGPLLRRVLLINITDKYCHMTSPWTHTGRFWWIKKKKAIPHDFENGSNPENEFPLTYHSELINENLSTGTHSVIYALHVTLPTPWARDLAHRESTVHQIVFYFITYTYSRTNCQTYNSGCSSSIYMLELKVVSTKLSAPAALPIIPKRLTQLCCLCMASFSASTCSSNTEAPFQGT